MHSVQNALPHTPLLPLLFKLKSNLFLTKSLRTSTTSWHGLHIQHASLASCVQERSASPLTMSVTEGHTWVSQTLHSPTNPTIMQVRIKSSKTDPFRKGVDIYLGRTHNSLCLIMAMMAYLSVRGDTAGPLFHFKDGKPLTRDRFVNKLQDTLRNIGICQGSYSGHSFRAGATTTAAQHGIPDATIQLLGRWQSTAYLVYIKTPRDKLASITATLSTSPK